jgi:hypothetical protein
LDGSNGFFDSLFLGKKQVTAPNQEDQKIKKQLSNMIGDTSLREYYLLHNESYFWNGAQVPEGQSLSPYRIQMRYAGSPLVKIFTSNHFYFTEPPLIYIKDYGETVGSKGERTFELVWESDPSQWHYQSKLFFSQNQ